MLRFKHKTLVAIAGGIWFLVGSFLLYVGLGLLVEGAHGNISSPAASKPLLSFFDSWLGSLEQAAMMIVAFALLIGFVKGKFVLAKSVKRLVDRIKLFDEPVPLFRMYSPPYYLLIACMMFLGMAMRYFQVPPDIRGFVDVAVGAALINGSMLYFREPLAERE